MNFDTGVISMQNPSHDYLIQPNVRNVCVLVFVPSVSRRRMKTFHCIAVLVQSFHSDMMIDLLIRCFVHIYKPSFLNSLTLCTTDFIQSHQHPNKPCKSPPNAVVSVPSEFSQISAEHSISGAASFISDVPGLSQLDVDVIHCGTSGHKKCCLSFFTADARLSCLSAGQQQHQ